jgi:signal transduction histidine kinase
MVAKGMPIDDLLRQLGADTDDAIDTLRDLARGIYPPLLAAEGLAAALVAQARKAVLPVTVEAQQIGRYDQATEAAIYFCCLEALQNIAKYANATEVRIRLEVVGTDLLFSVTDDGDGFDLESTSMGAGLTNMTDRIDALGGTLSVQSAPGVGTTISGRLPIAVDDA